MSSGTKHDSGKDPLELLSPQALREIAKVFGHGRDKYGAFNYRGGIEYGRLIGAAYRHLGDFNAGIDIDAESGLPHVAHLAATAIMLLDMLREHPELDNRYRPPSKPEIVVENFRCVCEDMKHEDYYWIGESSVNLHKKSHGYYCKWCDKRL